MYVVKEKIHSAFGIFEKGKKYLLSKVPKAVIEDWLTQTVPLIEKVNLKEMAEDSEAAPALDTVNEEPIEEESSEKKTKKKKYSEE